MKTAKGHEYSIKATRGGFIVAGHYSEYQFVRNSQSGFTGCAKIMNDAARTYAESLDKDVYYPKWDEIEIVDHGRDIITAVMHVNCRSSYEFQEPESTLVSDLERLKALLDSGAISASEYEAAKTKLLLGEQ